MLDIDPEEKPVPAWVGIIDLFAVAAGSKIPREIPRRVRREVLDIAARLRWVRARKALARGY